MTHIDRMTGRCLCGAISFEARDVDPGYTACHCRMCLRWSGAPFLGVSVGAVEFSGEDKLSRVRTSDWATRGFCRECGSNLFYYDESRKSYSICAGSFDDPSALELVGEIFIDRKPPGYTFEGEHPRRTEAEEIGRYLSEKKS